MKVFSLQRRGGCSRLPSRSALWSRLASPLLVALLNILSQYLFICYLLLFHPNTVIFSYLILSYPILSYYLLLVALLNILSYSILFYPIWYLISSYPSYLFISYLINLSCWPSPCGLCYGPQCSLLPSGHDNWVR